LKAAVTGASGHIGSALVRELLASGHTVRVLVRRDTRGLEGLPVERIEGDLGTEESLCRAFSGVDVVFHAAGRISVEKSDAARLFETNVEGTRHILAACRACGVRRLVHFSSVEALSQGQSGPAGHGAPETLEAPEDWPLVDGSSRDPYAGSKADGERAVRQAIDGGLDAVILYPTGVIGPFDFKPSMMGRAILALARGQFPALVPGGFDWVDVRDVAQAAVSAAERAPAGSHYLLGGRTASLVELAGLVCAAAGARPPALVVPTALGMAWAPIAAAAARLSGTPALFTSYTLRTLAGSRSVSHERATKGLGYRPRDLAQTVGDTCRWFAENGFLEGVTVR
jgi:dihydroflavonol-4-reductase